jgi:hypothetical protein
MKNMVTLLFLLVAGFCNSQETSDDPVLLENIGITFTIESVKELQELDLGDIKSIMEGSATNHPIKLEIVCNDKLHYGNARLNNASFKIEGNSNDIDGFMKNARKLKNSMRKFYKNLKTK